MADKAARDLYLRRKYGISQAVYEKMLALGGGNCWICQRPPKPGKSLAVDHDHKTGQVRGLLDWQCNKYLVGRRRREHGELYRRAADYLANPKDWRYDAKPRRQKKSKRSNRSHPRSTRKGS